MNIVMNLSVFFFRKWGIFLDLDIRMVGKSKEILARIVFNSTNSGSFEFESWKVPSSFLPNHIVTRCLYRTSPALNLFLWIKHRVVLFGNFHKRLDKSNSNVLVNFRIPKQNIFEKPKESYKSLTSLICDWEFDYEQCQKRCFILL